jgi:hypothetical protein
MRQNRIPIIQHVSKSVRQGMALDVYGLVAKLKSEFPGVPEPELVRIVSEEVVKAHGNAIWEKRDA